MTPSALLRRGLSFLPLRSWLDSSWFSASGQLSCLHLPSGQECWDLPQHWRFYVGFLAGFWWWAIVIRFEPLSSHPLSHPPNPKQRSFSSTQQSPHTLTRSHCVLNLRRGSCEASLSRVSEEMKGGVQSWWGRMGYSWWPLRLPVSV